MMERVIAIDVGAGTADIVIWEDGVPLENSVKLVVPSQTRVVAARIAAATRSGAAVLFTGPTMGGGADTRAMKAHITAGLPFLATEDAARSFADDLDRVRARGVTIVGDDEAAEIAARGVAPGGREIVAVRSGDIDAAALLDALRRLRVDTRFTGAAVAVQDHGFCHSGSNRVFRFSLWERAVREKCALHDLFYWMSAEETEESIRATGEPEEDIPLAGKLEEGAPHAEKPGKGIPPVLTRMRAAAGCAARLLDDGTVGDVPLPARRGIAAAGGPSPARHEAGAAAGRRVLAGDTGPAALLGALTDLSAPAAANEATVLVNVGNGHTIVAVARDGRLAGVYEHHTGLLDATKLEAQIRQFLTGELTGEQVRVDGGHGAVLAGPVEVTGPLLATGPNRALLRDTALPVCYAAPWGDMMIAGSVGLLEAFRTLRD